MRNRPLINESCLQKISGKAQHFMIRNKLSLSKGPRPHKTTANVETHQQQIMREVNMCSEILEKWLEEEEIFSKEDGTRVLKVLKEVRNRWSQLDCSSPQNEFQQNTSGVFLARNKSRVRMTTFEEFTESQNEQKVNPEPVLTKNKSSKLKLGKQNVNKYPVFWDIKLERLHGKIEQYEIKVEQYEANIKEMKQQIEKLKMKNSEFQEQLNKVQKQKNELGQKASTLVLQKIQIESNLKYQVIELENKMQDLKNREKVLQERLDERQRQMVALFQSNPL